MQEERKDIENMSDKEISVYNTTQDVPQLNQTGTRLTILGEGVGTVREYNEAGHALLIPSPSDDPNDPLNWSPAKKWYITALVCSAVFCCNLTTAGPSIAILEFAADFGVTVPKAAYLLTTAALMQGVSMLWWAPMIAKWGRRPIYVTSFVLYTVFIFASGACKTWNAQLGCRIIMAAASGAGEVLGPLTINDMFFVHQRTLPLALYNAFLSIGVGLALIVDGWITVGAGWRGIYWFSGGVVSLVTILVILSFPETNYRRGPQPNAYQGQSRNIDTSKRHSFARNLRLWPEQTWTKDSWGMLFLRPIALIAFPAVAWTTLVFAVTIGALVAVTSNVASAYGQTYGWGPGPTGTAFISACIGSVVGIIGGHYTDKWSSGRTRGNGGVREPEMRLLPILPALITTPLALVLYGLGIQNKLHWIVPTIGLGLMNFSIVWGTTVAMVYMIDCLKPLAEEAVTSVLAIKACIGFLLSFYTNPWIAEAGYLNMYGEFAGISAFCLCLVFVFIAWGKPIRKHAIEWRLIQKIKWHQDRDDVIIEDE